MRRSLALAILATLCCAVSQADLANATLLKAESNPDAFSLVQSITLMQMHHRWLRRSTGARAWLEDPALRERLSKLLLQHGQDPGQLNASRVEEVWQSPLKAEMEDIMRDELQKRGNTSHLEALQELPPQEEESEDLRRKYEADRRRQEREAERERKDSAAEERRRTLDERKRSGEQKARKRREKSDRRKELYEERRRWDREETSREKGENGKDEEQHRKSEEGSRRRHEEAVRRRQQREEERKLREEAELQHKKELLQRFAEEEGKLKKAEEAARRAEEEKVRWEAAEAAAQRKAAEQQKLEVAAEESEEKAKQLEEAARLEEEKAKEAMEEQWRLEEAAREAEAKAVEEEAKWEALAAEAKREEELVQEEERKAEEEAKAKAAEDNRIKAEEDAKLKALEDTIREEEEEARRKAAEDARRRAEEEARVKAEEEARAKAEEEAEEEAKARAKAEEEARARADEETRASAKAEKKGEDVGNVAKDMGTSIKAKANDNHSSKSTEVEGSAGAEATSSGGTAEGTPNGIGEERAMAEEEAEKTRVSAEEDAGIKAEPTPGTAIKSDTGTKGEDAGTKGEDAGSKAADARSKARVDSRFRVDMANAKVERPSARAKVRAHPNAGAEDFGSTAEERASSVARWGVSTSSREEDVYKKGLSEEVSTIARERARNKAEVKGAGTAGKHDTSKRAEEDRDSEDAATTKAQEAEDASIKAEEEAKAQAQREFERLKSQMEAKLQAEEEARVKAEQEAARLKAELDSRLRSEFEAKVEAEEAARLKAEEEARRKAAEEASLKAKEDARLAAEGEAKRKAEEEAKKKAEEDARQVEEDAKLKDPNTEIKGEDSKLLHNVATGDKLDFSKVENTFDGRFDDSVEVQSILGTFDEQGHVCVKPEDLAASLRQSKQAVLQGLPEWTQREVPSQVKDVVIAFLIQASWEEQLPVLRRTFDRLYMAKDLYLYTVDRERMDIQKVIEALPSPLPQNVVVQPSAHSDYFVWPRVEIVLSGLRTLLSHTHKWDFVIHLSESDYPVHNLNWIRKSLALQRNTNFIQIIPRCQRNGDSGLDFRRDDWYWWTQRDAMSSCGSEIEVKQVEGVTFPMDKLENHGFRFAHGAEWMVVTRELVKYALSPELFHYRKLVGMHVGADEIFWQTLILNIPNFKQVVSQQGWFIRWGHGKTDHSPDTLNEKYEQQLLQHRHEFFFMRKVSAADSGKLLDDIDALAQQPDSVPGPIMVQKPGDDWSLNTVACPESLQFLEEEYDEPVDDSLYPSQDFHAPPPSKSRHWQGTKSRKQLVEAYKWYMQNQ